MRRLSGTKPGAVYACYAHRGNKSQAPPKYIQMLMHTHIYIHTQSNSHMHSHMTARACVCPFEPTKYTNEYSQKKKPNFYNCLSVYAKQYISDTRHMHTLYIFTHTHILKCMHILCGHTYTHVHVAKHLELLGSYGDRIAVTE